MDLQDYTTEQLLNELRRRNEDPIDGDLLLKVLGSTPNYEVMNDPIIKKYGQFYGGMSDRWEWNRGDLKGASNSELYHMYKTCHNSWSWNAKID